MNQPVSPAPQTSRTAPIRRRTRSALRRKSTAESAAPAAPAAPQPRETAEAVKAVEEVVASDRPLLSWVLVTDDNGRTRPEAHWA
ncbi:hypothetical protein [Streptomonospora litoralis]|uniref:Uncharacterized protein n=1 Tax=Streptomonospora litoralis TaxID=2498135 RepID=A0A4P6Q7D8_9ACTN|nr:hypothetical protein [Streptomonospora litoralis]QBI56708.1 hypothetical protein EKD16_24835 [Streptomonospora litoralis]